MQRLTIVFILFLITKYSFCQNDLIKTIYFKNNSFSLAKADQDSLNLVASNCSKDKDFRIKIFGYSDTTGSKEYNNALSQKRAFAVYNYLSSHCSIDSSQIYIEWLGKSDESYDLHFPKAHVQQRCVDVWVRFYKRQEDK